MATTSALVASDDAARLIDHSIKVLKAFKPALQTVDTHVASYLDAAGKALSPADGTFIQQVFYGCERHSRLLGAFLDAFYHVRVASVSRADYHLYLVLAYLALFRLDELTWPRFAALLDAQNHARMCTFLSFLYSEADMRQWVKEQWCKFLDRGYIEGTLQRGLDRHRSAAMAWVGDRSAAAFGAFATQHLAAGATAGSGGASTSPKRRTTVAVAPRLSTSARSRATGGGSGAASTAYGAGTLVRAASAGAGLGSSGGSVALMMAAAAAADGMMMSGTGSVIVGGGGGGGSVITGTGSGSLLDSGSRRFRAHPVPAHLDATTLDGLAAADARRRERTQALTLAKYDPERDVPKLAETRNTVDKLRSEQEAKVRAACTFQPAKHTSPPPKSPPPGEGGASSPANVRLNAAAVLREDAVFRKQQEEEAAVMRAYMVDRRDASGFEVWRATEEAADEAKRAAATVALKHHLQESAARATAARDGHARRLSSAAADQRKRRAAGEAAVAAATEYDVDCKREVVAAVRAMTAAAPTAAKATVAATNRARAIAIQEARVAAEAAAAEERRREQAERDEAIRVLRAQEAVPRESTLAKALAATPGGAMVAPTLLPSPRGKGLGHGVSGTIGVDSYLDEMTQDEARERLAFQAAREAEALEAKRAAIAEGKTAREARIVAKIESIGRVREDRRAVRAVSKESREAAVAAAAAARAAAEEVSALAMDSKLTARRAVLAADAERAARANAAIAARAAALAASAAASDERRMASLVTAEYRRTAAETGRAFTDKALADYVAATAAASRVAADHAAAQSALLREIASREASELAASQAKDFSMAERARRGLSFLETVEYEATQRDIRDAANPPAASARQAEREAARARTLARTGFSGTSGGDGGVGLLLATGGTLGSGGGTLAATAAAMLRASEKHVVAARMERLPPDHPLRHAMAIRVAR